MTVNISSLQSELLKLLNANGDIEDEESLNMKDYMSSSAINGNEDNKDLKGGDDVGAIVDNLTGGNASANEDKPNDNNTSAGDIVSNILVEDKTNNDNDNDNDDNNSPEGENATPEEIIDQIVNQDELLSGGKKNKSNNIDEEISDIINIDDKKEKPNNKPNEEESALHTAN